MTSSYQAAATLKLGPSHVSHEDGGDGWPICGTSPHRYWHTKAESDKYARGGAGIVTCQRCVHSPARAVGE